MFDRIHRLRWGAATAGVFVAAAVLAGCANPDDEKQQTSLEPKGDIADKILDLFTPWFYVASVIGIGVIGATIYVALRFREKPGEERNPKQTHGNTVLEIGWTIVPALILAAMAIPTVATIFDLAEKPDNAIRIRVTAKHWFWEFEYPDEAVVTANEMHIPINRPIELIITAPADGVIHSFWVPNLAGKKDAVPGREHFLALEADEVGTYLGQCAEYCGLSHADMRLRVIAESPDEFEDWVARQRAEATAEQAAFIETTLGEQWGCTSCHAFAGVSEAPIGPNLTHVGDRATFAAGVYEANADNFEEWVFQAPEMKPMDEYVNAMPNFSERGMTRDDARAIAEFLCNTGTTDENVQRCLSTEGTGKR
ncbi:MAG: cytochrome c oxidase subunit II [Actinomycetota bacterium]